MARLVVSCRALPRIVTHEEWLSEPRLTGRGSRRMDAGPSVVCEVVVPAVASAAQKRGRQVSSGAETVEEIPCGSVAFVPFGVAGAVWS